MSENTITGMKKAIKVYCFHTNCWECPFNEEQSEYNGYEGETVYWDVCHLENAEVALQQLFKYYMISDKITPADMGEVEEPIWDE